MNYHFLCFLIVSIVGIILNMIYVLVTNIIIKEIILKFANFCFAYSPVFFLIVCISLLNPMKVRVVISRNIQVVILFLYTLVLSVSLFIPNAIYISDTPNKLTIWGLPYYLYIILVFSIVIVIPMYYLALGTIYKNFENDIPKIKWRNFMIGITMLLIEIYSIFTSNIIDNASVRTIVNLVSLVLSISGAYLIYYGIKFKQEHLEKN